LVDYYYLQRSIILSDGLNYILYHICLQLVKMSDVNAPTSGEQTGPPPSHSNPSNEIEREGTTSSLGLETLESREEPLPLSSRIDLIEDVSPNKKDNKTGIELIDVTGDLPIPSNQNIDLVQHENSDAQHKSKLVDARGFTAGIPGVQIESVDVGASPIPASQNIDLVQHENLDSQLKSKLQVESTNIAGASPIPANPNNIDAVQLENAAPAAVSHEATTTSLLNVSIVTDSVSNRELQFPCTDAVEERILTPSEMISYSNTSIQQNERNTTSTAVMTAETTVLTDSFNNHGADILIPQATLVPDYDPSIPSASIVEPERNSLTIMGRKISPMFLAVNFVGVIAIVISLSVVLTRRNNGSRVNDGAPSSAPSVSLYPSSTPSIEPSSSPTPLIYSELMNVITEKTGFNESSFSDVQSTRRIALDWLANDIKLAQTESRSIGSIYSEVEIIERYTLFASNLSTM
jgi:hypothetical protein